MTDLQRAAEVVDAMGREIGDDRVFWPETWRRKIQAALAAARREGVEVAFREGMEHAARIDKAMLDNAQRLGEEEMRERAAGVARDFLGVEVRQDGVSLRLLITDAIRALPLTPAEGGA